MDKDVGDSDLEICIGDHLGDLWSDHCQAPAAGLENNSVLIHVVGSIAPLTRRLVSGTLRQEVFLA